MIRPRAAAAEFATLAGWLNLEFTKDDVSLAPDSLPNEKLKAAAERALEAGHALVVPDGDHAPALKTRTLNRSRLTMRRLSIVAPSNTSSHPRTTSQLGALGGPPWVESRRSGEHGLTLAQVKVVAVEVTGVGQLFPVADRH